MESKMSKPQPSSMGTNATDLDLTEYDQIDEFRHLITDNQLRCDNSKLLLTLSSSSDHTILEDTNCENDFVFLPAPLNQHHQQQQQREYPTRSRVTLPPTEISKIINVEPALDAGDNKAVSKLILQQPNSLPLISLNNNGNNPFGKYRDTNSEVDPYNQRQSAIKREVVENCLSKPYGLIEVCQSLGNNANKLADLMQQIVTRSDLIHIAIPCAYCHEPVACPPTDISSWVNHMSRQHNCKVCPVCNKMVGLGPNRDVNIMRKHVIEHLDNDWLERRANKINFTFGLQQQWFSGTRCVVRDLNQR